MVISHLLRLKTSTSAKTLISYLSTKTLILRPTFCTSVSYLDDVASPVSVSPPVDSKPTLSSRMTFVFDQIDAIHRQRSESNDTSKDEALQQIRAWRHSKQKQEEQAVKDGGEESVGNVIRKEVEMVHPWPEWIEFMERLLQQNYFDHKRFHETGLVENAPHIDLGNVSGGHVDEELGSEFWRDWASVCTACKNFGHDRFDILRSLSRKDIQVLVSHGCPSLDGKVIQSSKLLRKLAHVNEGDVCSACSLRSTCKKGFLLVPKEDEARTLDVVRVLLTFGFDSINGLVQNKPLTKLKSVKMVIRKLLHQIVKLSSVPIDPNLPRPVIKKPIPKVKQAPPLPKKRVGRDDVEMKKGDWLCEKCDFMNFAKNAICLQCDAKRPKRQLLPGEWECPQCNFLNYRRNMECFHCECKRPHDEFMESQSHAKKHEPRVGPPGNLRAPNVSDAWNFDFDENESDGADVAAFEFADPPRRGEGASLNAEPHGETSRRWSDDHVDYDKMPRNHEGSRQFVDSNDRNPHPHAIRTGFDDFDDEEDDVDSYEIDMESDYKTSVARKNFSEFENESEAEEFNDIRHRQDAKQSIDDSDGDMMGFDSEVNIPDFPSLKTRRNRDISYGSEDDVNLHSDSDGDFSTETRRRSRKISDRKQNLSSDRMSGSRSAFENADAVRQSRGAQRYHQGLDRDDFSSHTGSNDKTRWDSGFEDNNFSGYTKHNRRGDTGTFKRPSRRLGFDRRGDADSDDRPRWGSKFEDSDFSGRMEHNRSDDAGSYNRPSRDSGFDQKSDAGNDDIPRRGSKFEDSDFSGLMEHNRSGDAVSYNRPSRGSGFDQRGGTRSNDRPHRGSRFDQRGGTSSNDRPRRNSGFEDSDFSGRTEYNRRSDTGGFNQSSRGLGFDRRGAKGSNDRHRLDSDRSGGRRGCDSTGFDRPFREVRSTRSRSDERPYRRINER